MRRKISATFATAALLGVLLALTPGCGGGYGGSGGNTGVYMPPSPMPMPSHTMH